MIIESGWSWNALESPFKNYFDRCKSIGMTFYDIEKQLPFLEKYYQEMVVEKRKINDDFWWLNRRESIKDFFELWKQND